MRTVLSGHLNEAFSSSRLLPSLLTRSGQESFWTVREDISLFYMQTEG